MSEVTELLTVARQRAGLSQRRLGIAAAIPQASVSRIERGLISPRASTIERWLEACGMRLQLEPISGTGVDRTLLRARLAMSPLERSRLGAREANAMLRLQQGRLRSAPR